MGKINQMFSPELNLFLERLLRKQAMRKMLINNIVAPTTMKTDITNREKGFGGNSPSGVEANGFGPTDNPSPREI
jgi:hypothetical protein